MARFQAMTNAVLERELDELREQMGLRENQKAELLRELAAMASWLLYQARAGRTIEARGESGVEVFRHPALDTSGPLARMALDEDEAQRLATLLDAEAEPSPALRATLARLTDPDRGTPSIRWPNP